MVYIPSLTSQALNYAAANPDKVIKTANSLYDFGAKVYRDFNQPTAKSAPQVTYNKVFVPRTYSRRTYPRTFRRTYTAYKKKFTRPVQRKYRKKAKLNKLVGKPVGRKSIYNKRAKKMRTYNTGKLSLQSRFQNGGSLPNTTFARLFWRGSQTCNFSNLKFNATAGTASQDVQSRTYCLNDISLSPSYSNLAVMKHTVTYAPIWKSLYKQYIILGATAKFKINPSFYPTSYSTSGLPPGASQQAPQVPRNAQPGYWYVRAYYKRSTPYLSDDGAVVGHPISPSPNSTVADPKTEILWPTLREFLSDPTVTYKKDKTNVRSKLHVHTAGDIYANSPSAMPSGPSTGVSYEIETATRPVYLKVNFSAKKHFQDKNILRNGSWIDWDENLPESERFQVRFGYIGFANNGTTSYHVPIDRNMDRFVETEIQYFVGLRDPLVNPHSEQLSNISMAREAIEQLPDTFDEELESEYDPDEFDEDDDDQQEPINPDILDKFATLQV